MKKEQFFVSHQNSNISSSEIERKFQAYLREQEEQQMLYEAARASSIAAIASGAGGGYVAPNPISFYGFGFISPYEGQFISIDPEGNQEIIGETFFDGTVVFCKNTDDGKMYYVYQDTIEEEMVVGYIDITNGVVTELDRSVLSTESYSAPTSLYYLGSNQFLYVDNVAIYGSPSSIQQVFVINIIDDVVTLETGSAIASFDAETFGWSMTSLFTYNGEFWGSVFSIGGTPIAGFARYNLESGISDLGNPVSLEGYPFSEMIKIIYFLGISQSPTGDLYSIAFGVEKDTDNNFLCIVKLDVGNYNSFYVQNIIVDTFLPTDIEIA